MGNVGVIPTLPILYIEVMITKGFKIFTAFGSVGRVVNGTMECNPSVLFCDSY